MKGSEQSRQSLLDDFVTEINLIGKNILGYTVVEKINSGAFGTVYKVAKTNVAGQYIRALKHVTIPTERQYNSVLNSMGGDVSKVDNYFLQMLKTIVSEIRILNDLSEKDARHIVRYYENDILVSDEPKRYDIFILMECLTPLEDFIQNKDFFVNDVVKVGLDVLYGLQVCHDNGIMHRDIKADNIFVSGTGEYKIGDFGVSKVLKDSSKAESLKGTPNYLAPEVYLGKESYTKSVDLYALGIVLYRLLNYNRNPFLPPFPEQYFAQDEDVAFEKRMSGEIPDLPALGGEKIGRVIVKALSNSAERFQSADEFISELKLALNETTSEILQENTKIGTFFHTELLSEENSKQYGSTISETSSQFAAEKNMENEYNTTLNRHLFETVGEVPFTNVPESESLIRTEENYRCESVDEDAGVNIGNRGIGFIPAGMNESDESVVWDRNRRSKIIFLIPAIICLVGVVTYLVVLPNMYGKVISFIDWLFTNPQGILNILHDQDAVVERINSVVIMKAFWWIWLIGFIASLFFVGKQLQEKREPIADNAILKNKAPYLMIQNFMDALKRVKVRNSSKQLDSLIYSVKCLEEKLSIESDFGCGKAEVIDCENDIAKQIYFLLDNIECIENGEFEKNMETMREVVEKINSLLRKRIELKKK